MKYFIEPVNYITSLSGGDNLYIANVIELLNKGASIPFIARYRKEMTGSMDEVRIAEVIGLYKTHQELEKRKSSILESIKEQEKLTKDLEKLIINAMDMNTLEDLYLPYKPKRRTRASKARELGLQPLAEYILCQKYGHLDDVAVKYISDDVPTIEYALSGARDIIAEIVSESDKARNILRRIFERQAILVSKVTKNKEEEAIKYSDYFDFSESLLRIRSHRMLAIRRGESEGFLRISLKIDDDLAVSKLENMFVNANNESSRQIATAIKDSYKRLLYPSIETEFLNSSKIKADNEAIKVFATNLSQLLLAPPLGSKRIMGIDPGFRTGCKIVCLDETGALLHNETIYPHPPRSERKYALNKLSQLTETYRIDAIAIGNGTAGRETEDLIAKIRFNREVKVFVVSENGASIYSASKIARDEFPNYDITVRGAVSIGRRLMDPLSELVKIEPKSIGVGQYQYDVDQTKLKESLDAVVELCVNKVGVDLNTSGKYILRYVSGLGESLANNIVEYRNENGIFKSREELKKVHRMGDKSFEQCAGFLRISGGSNPLDNSSVHPEAYFVVNDMARDLSVSVASLIGNEELCSRINIEKYVRKNIGIPTLTDIVEELKKPGRDPRKVAEIFSFSPDIHSIDDLKEGVVVPAIVTNITDFGIFVDIGAKQDGLVHISEMSDSYISNPSELVHLHQHIQVKVLDVDKIRKRISLSMKNI